jgi:hypothetical protein
VTPPSLPPDGPLVLGGVRLPPGHRVVPGRGAGAGDLAVLWVTDAPVPDAGAAWSRLAVGHATTGMWPVLLTSRRDLSGAGDPWDATHLEPEHEVGATVDRLSPLAVLTFGWAGDIDDEAREPPGEELAPFGAAFPGLAPPAPSGWPRHDIGAVVTALPDERIGLVVAGRPADVPAIVGFTGTVNVGLEATALAAVLRSWEDRYGAVLCRMGNDSIDLAVAAPPRDAGSALAIAAEHHALDPDLVLQGVGTLRALSAHLIGRPLWSFWWD